MKEVSSSRTQRGLIPRFARCYCTYLSASALQATLTRERVGLLNVFRRSHESAPALSSRRVLGSCTTGPRMEGLIGEGTHVSVDSVNAARQEMLAAKACLRQTVYMYLVNEFSQMLREGDGAT